MDPLDQAVLKLLLTQLGVNFMVNGQLKSCADCNQKNCITFSVFQVLTLAICAGISVASLFEASSVSAVSTVSGLCEMDEAFVSRKSCV